MSERQELLRKAIQGLVVQVTGDSSLVEEILTRVVIDTIRRYQDKVGAGIEDSVADILATFKLKVAQEIFDVSQTWTLASKREMIIFPPGCRFLYTMGRSTFVVIEQAPANRTLNLDSSLLDSQVGRNTQHYERHSLSIPYGVFILHFRNGRSDGRGSEGLIDVYYAWRQSPLSSMTDMLYRPFLPNLHLGLAVCRGRDASAGSETQTWDGAMINRITNEVISEFWNSRFNSDLATAWWDKQSRSEVSTVEDWARNTRDNPLFILGVRLTEEKTLGVMLSTLVSAAEEQESDVSALRHRLTDSIDVVSTEVFSKVVRYLKKTKFDRYYPKDVTKQLGDALGPVAEQIRVLAAAIEMELNRLTHETDKKQSISYGWERRGPYWLNKTQGRDYVGQKA